MKKQVVKSQYDYMKESEFVEEDALYPEEIISKVGQSDKEKYFEFYDDIKTTPKDDW